MSSISPVVGCGSRSPTAHRKSRVPRCSSRAGSQYFASPTIGVPSAARCRRIWCVRPVCGKHSTTDTQPHRVVACRETSRQSSRSLPCGGSRCGVSGNDRSVSLAHAPLREGGAEPGQCSARLGYHKQPTRARIQPVHVLGPPERSFPLRCAIARHGSCEQLTHSGARAITPSRGHPCRLVHHGKRAVGKHHFQRIDARRRQPSSTASRRRGGHPRQQIDLRPNAHFASVATNRPVHDDNCSTAGTPG
eukprot:scaffold9840_cov139-Isochrysis_galbana.AAC.5